MYHKRRSPPGSAPATLVPHSVDGDSRHPKIDAIFYDAGKLVEAHSHSIEEIFSKIGAARFAWINISGLGDLETLKSVATRMKIHPLALEDVLNLGQRPKVEEADDYLFVIAQMVYLNREKAFCHEQISMFIADNLLVSIQEEPEFDVFDQVRARLRAGRSMIRQSGVDYLAYAMIDSIVDHYYPVLENVGNRLDQLERLALTHPTRDLVEQIRETKRTLTQLRRLAWPMRELVSSLMHDTRSMLSKTTKVYLRDCYEHTVQLMDLIESYREVSAGLMDLYVSSVGLRTNEIMRVLTVITSIFIPLTFIVGIYGMNFSAVSAAGKPMPLNMPELNQPYGYLSVMAVMFIIAAVQIYLFRRMKWL